jgi:hypothetical protein
MPPENPWSRRIGTRLTALAVAAPLAAIAFAAPAAAAEVPGLESADAHWEIPTTAVAGDYSDGTVDFDLVASAGQEETIHAISFDLRFDDPAGLLEFEPRHYCTVDATGSTLSCTRDVDAGSYFMDLAFFTLATPEVDTPVEYTISVEVDGIEIASGSGLVEVLADGEANPHRPYLHGDLAFADVTPGSTVETKPVFRQERDLADAAAAIVAGFTDSFSRMGVSQEGADAIADYDNCTASRDTIRGGVECVITDFTSQTGTALTFSDPIGYAIGADALGPFEVCSCDFYVQTVDAATLAADFGDLTWDPASENLLGIEPAASWTDPADPEMAEHWGQISITTSANPLDLAVTGGAFDGNVGTESTVTVPVANNGPATIYNREDVFGSASIRVQLPEGTALASIDSDASEDWSCLDQESLALEYGRTETTLDRYDLYCFLMTPLAAGETVDFTFTASLTAPGPELGWVEIAALTTGPNGATLDSDTANNLDPLENLSEQLILPRNDFTGDGLQDLVSVRKSDGALVLYAGTADGKLVSSKVFGTGWSRLDVAMAGDLTGDGFADLLARDNRTGYLYTYPGNGASGFGARVKVGSGWGAMGLFTCSTTTATGPRTCWRSASPTAR